MRKLDDNKSTTGTGLDLWDIALIAFLVLCIYGALDPSIAEDVVKAVGKAVGQ